MRILAAGLRSLQFAEGGVETHARSLYPLIASSGIDVEVAVRTPFQPADAPQLWNGVAIRPIWSPRSPGLEALVHTFLATLYAIRSRPDVFHLHAVGPALLAPLARLFGLKVVVTHHGPDYDREKWSASARFVLRLGERLGMRFASRRIVISATIQDLVMRRYGLESTIVPNGVDHPTAVHGESTITDLGLQRGRYILQVSRFVPEKRQLELLGAFQRAELPDWKLAFVGAVDCRSSYTRSVVRAASADARVVLAGYREGAELAELFTHAGLFVLPSSHEGLPIALLEALSYGLPVVASDIPANTEIGLASTSYYPLGDVDALTDRLRESAAAHESPELRESRKRWVLERYDWEAVARSTAEIYRSLSPNSSL